ncbi:SDR family oxidoreductase [Desulfobacterota bacterium AH_259_B03_O07]|nr:SDR family oxidoreductase [Desulfobacterota bacterium AH_259_B03_O07]
MGFEEIENNVVLITGGSDGIGLGIAHAFSDAGAKVAITGLDKLKTARENVGGEILTIKADITQVELCRDTLDKVLEEFGKLDILVNNAGTNIYKPTSQTTIQEFDLIFNTNVRGLFALTQTAIPELKKTHGNIINIGSVFGFRGMPIYSVYSASKAAVIMLTQLWAKELAPDIRVNTISPGGIDTAIFPKMYGEEKIEQVLEFVSGRHLMKRMGQPEEIARMALYLATENWVTGSNFVVDGGLFHLI